MVPGTDSLAHLEPEKREVPLRLIDHLTEINLQGLPGIWDIYSKCIFALAADKAVA